jgi:hypothetical protein
MAPRITFVLELLLPRMVGDITGCPRIAFKKRSLIIFIYTQKYTYTRI